MAFFRFIFGYEVLWVSTRKCLHHLMFIIILSIAAPPPFTL